MKSYIGLGKNILEHSVYCALPRLFCLKDIDKYQYHGVSQTGTAEQFLKLGGGGQVFFIRFVK